MLARGQVYIGLIISMAILAILSQAIVTLVFSSYDLLNFTAARTTARYLAQEKMEIVRNLPYASVGTTGGIPTGSLQQVEDIDRNGLNYVVRTSVIYVDDAYDNKAPTDLLPTDYKRVRIEVSWGGLSDSGKNPVVLVSDVAPKDIEQSVNGGTLSIFVLNASGDPLSGATAHIVANTTTPKIDLTLNTGANGRIVLPGSPVCNACYQVTITKDGYSTDRTYSTTEVANPAKPHQTIIKNKLTEISFAIDRTVNLDIFAGSSRASGFAALSGVSLTVHGDKTIGTDSTGNAVYKLRQTVSTNSTGHYVFSNIDADTYTITQGATYDYAGINPLLPVAVAPGASGTALLSLVAHTNHTLLDTFTDTGTNPIASVTARLKNSGGQYVATSSSGLLDTPDFGQVFFGGLTSGSYTLEATASGYANVSKQINVSGQIQDKTTMTSQ